MLLYGGSVQQSLTRTRAHTQAHVSLWVVFYFFVQDTQMHEQDWKKKRNPTHVCNGRKRLFQYLILACAQMPRLYCSAAVSAVGGGGDGGKWEGGI